MSGTPHPTSETLPAAELCEVVRAVGRCPHTGIGPFLQVVAGSLASVLPGSFCACFVADERHAPFLEKAAAGGRVPEALRARLRGGLVPATDPVVSELSRRGTVVRYENGDGRPLLSGATCDTLGIRAAVAWPLGACRWLRGFVLCVDTTATGGFASERVELAEAIIAAAITALDRLRLQAELDQILAERHALKAVTAAVLGEGDLNRALELVCREAQSLTGAEGCAVLLLGEDDRLRVACSLGAFTESCDRLLPDSLRYATRLPVEPVLLDDVARDLAVPEAKVIRSMIAVPLTVHGRAIGLLQLINGDTSFRDEHLRGLGLLADRLAIAIEHVRLHERHERMAVVEERQRLARDLHDSVTQSVYGVSAFAEAAARLLQAGKADEAAGLLRELRDTAQKALWEMRLLVFELRPPDIEKHDLVTALQMRLASVETRAGLRTTLHYEGVGLLPKPVEEGLYRIAQEAMNNSIKHARATTISVRLTGSARDVRLEFEDDGQGFDLDAGRSKGGLGLRGMEERASAMGGTLEIRTEAGRGTRISVSVPLLGPGR